MKYKPIFVMGTSSGAGKSTLVTALCRILTKKGLNVSPFKAQNMSLNAGVGIGGEMAYAQVIQAKACGKIPDVRMNPVLLKPEEGKTQIILNGKYFSTMDPKNYMQLDKDYIFSIVIKDFNYISRKSDIVVVEGAGSPAEINLKNDIANIKLARSINSKNILLADIDRGGAFASIAGTVDLIGNGIFSGYIFNKFRGDESLLYDGIKYFEEKYNLTYYGTIPFIDVKLPQEASLWSWYGKGGKIKLSIVKLPHISNFTDFQIFFHIKEVGINFAHTPEEIGNADAIIIPGSKLTVSDLNYLKREGFVDKIREMHREGTQVIGICGGFQMMGKYIIDNVETNSGKVEGIGLLDAKTKFSHSKEVGIIQGRIISDEFKNLPISGYEIHLGTTLAEKPFSLILNKNGKNVEKFDGSVAKNAFGTYFHDLFYNKRFLESFLEKISKDKGIERINVSYSLEKEIDRIAEVVERSIDVGSLLEKF